MVFSSEMTLTSVKLTKLASTLQILNFYLLTMYQLEDDVLLRDVLYTSA